MIVTKSEVTGKLRPFCQYTFEKRNLTTDEFAYFEAKMQLDSPTRGKEVKKRGEEWMW